MSETLAIPLRRRDGSVRAVALVDAEDFDRLASRRWHLADGYARSLVRGTGPLSYLKLHREVLGLGPGDPDVDHINHDRLDCRRATAYGCVGRKQTHIGLFQTAEDAAAAASAWRARNQPYSPDAAQAA